MKNDPSDGKDDPRRLAPRASAHFLVAMTVMLVALDVSTARACSDAGPGNALCNEGGAQWILCSHHSDCPAGQMCAENGACRCGSECIEEQCDGEGCRCCVRPDAGGTCWVAFVCDAPDAGPGIDVDAGIAMDGAVMDGAVMDGGIDVEPAGGCAVGVRGAALPWALAAIVALTLRRRRTR